MPPRRTLGGRAAAICILVATLSLAPPASAGPRQGRARALDGILRVWHADDFRGGESRWWASLDTGRERIALRLPPPLRRLDLSGTRVRVRGQSLGDQFLVQSLEKVTGTTAPDEDTKSPAPGTVPSAVNVAVILFNFSNDSSQPYTVDQARGVGFTNPSSVSAYFGEATYGQITVSGDAFGWFNIAADNNTCATGTWASLAREAASAAGVDLTAYQRFVYGFPRVSACGWAGLASGSNAFLNGSTAMRLRVFGHELGHTFGLRHARSMSCTFNGVRVSLSTSCTRSEYGDPFDVMGAAETRHPNNRNRANAGWLNGRTYAITATGTYALSPAALPAPSAPQLLRIARPDGSSLNLELRRPYGSSFESYPNSDPAVNGITIRYGASTGQYTDLLDMTPATGSFGDASLAVGQTFLDSAGGIRITTLSVSSDRALVDITLGGGPDTQAPTTPGSLMAISTGPDGVSLSWQASTDDLGVAGYRVFRDGVLRATVTATGFSEGGLSPATTYAYAVIAVDAAGNASAPAEQWVTTLSPDVQPPTAPSNLLAQAGKGRRVLLSWAASSDDVGVTGYSLHRNDVLVATTTGTSYIDSLPGSVRSSVTYHVVAFDGAGNVSPPSNTVVFGR